MKEPQHLTRAPQTNRPDPSFERTDILQTCVQSTATDGFSMETVLDQFDQIFDQNRSIK